MENQTTQVWYEKSYKSEGLAAQRLYPNEELLRFLGRNYFSLSPDQRASLKILEVGCGSCSNLWMIAKEGFEAHGLDLSPEAISLGDQMLQKWGTQARLQTGDMTDLPYEDSELDSVCDVFSGNCLTMEQFGVFAREAHRVLKSGGRFFIYTPSTGSDAFKNHAPSKKLDELTLDGIHRKDSPYYGNFYPYRFSEPDWIQGLLTEIGFDIQYSELIRRTYHQKTEIFEHLSLEAVKK